MNEKLNGDAHRSVMQCRVDKADDDWREGRKDEAFVGVLNCIALLSSAVAQLSRSCMDLAENVEASKVKNDRD